jgi:hypothetical protein
VYKHHNNLLFFSYSIWRLIIEKVSLSPSYISHIFPKFLSCLKTYFQKMFFKIFFTRYDLEKIFRNIPLYTTTFTHCTFTCSSSLNLKGDGKTCDFFLWFLSLQLTLEYWQKISTLISCDGDMLLQPRFFGLCWEKYGWGRWGGEEKRSQ